MSNTTEAADSDINWLKQRLNRELTEDEECDFIEYVALAVIDGKCKEDFARDIAFKSMFGWG